MTKEKFNIRISVIVPIYNAECYLRYSIDSILAQTHKNIEILLVDDGSTDSSGKIADTYAKKDERIKVIHQANTGVSCARNSALDIATGAWVVFVDADDILLKYSVETMLRAAIDSKSQCACGRFRRFSENVEESLVGTIKNDSSSYVLGRKEAISSLLYQRDIANAPFAKLYSMESIGKLRFREDISVAEDLLFNYTVIKNLKQVVIVDKIVYFYRNHSNSVINKSFSIKRMSGLRATSLILADIQKQDLPVKPATNRHFMEAMFILSQMSLKNNYAVAHKKCIKVIKNYRKSVFQDSRSPVMYRSLALLSAINPFLAVYAFKIKVGFTKILKMSS